MLIDTKERLKRSAKPMEGAQRTTQGEADSSADRVKKTNLENLKKKLMPIKAEDLIVPGAGVLSTGINAVTQINQNKRERRHAIYMYDRQRADALADYQMQNEYNHPSAQMERLKQAGLNPNLVYGSGATTEGGSVRSSSAPSWSPEAPKVDLQTPVMGFYDAQIKQAQVDNLRADNTVKQQEAFLKAAQTIDTLASGDTKQFDLALKGELKETTIEAAKAALAQTEASTGNTLAHTKATLDANDRAAALQASTLQQALENILNSRKARAKTDADIRHIEQIIENLKKDQKLKQLDIDLKEKGIQPSDNIVMRMIARILERLPELKTHTNPLYKYDQRRSWDFLTPPSFKKDH